MLIYLDNCCFNRPFDDQGQTRIRIESEAKLVIQSRIHSGELSLVWSYILEFENSENPYDERRDSILRWKPLASRLIGQTAELLQSAELLGATGFRSKDALHLAAALEAGCDYFITTDDGILKKAVDVASLKVINPVDFFTRELL